MDDMYGKYLNTVSNSINIIEDNHGIDTHKFYTDDREVVKLIIDRYEVMSDLGYSPYVISSKYHNNILDINLVHVEYLSKDKLCDNLITKIGNTISKMHYDGIIHGNLTIDDIGLYNGSIVFKCPHFVYIIGGKNKLTCEYIKRKNGLDLPKDLQLFQDRDYYTWLL